MVCIGYAGIDAFDLILYIGRTITRLKYKVLIIDLSDTGSLMNAIKHPVDLDSRVDIIQYRGINYTRKIPSKEELDEYREGMIIVSFGWNCTLDIPFELSTINFVVNTLPNMIHKLVELMKQVDGHGYTQRILLRDVICLEDLEQVYRNPVLNIGVNNISYLYMDITEYERAVQCQLRQVIRFPGVSNRMKHYIQEQIKDILPQLRQSTIRKALYAASKGV